MPGHCKVTTPSSFPSSFSRDNTCCFHACVSLKITSLPAAVPVYQPTPLHHQHDASFHTRDARKCVVPNTLTHPLCSPPSLIIHSGDGQFGQLGHGDGDIRSCPTLVQSLIDDPSGCGKSRNQHHSMRKAKSRDKKHDHPGQALRAVACGAFHTAIVNNDGELLTFGLGTSGQVRTGCGRMRRVRCAVGCFGIDVVLLSTAAVLLPGEARRSLIRHHTLCSNHTMKAYALHPSSSPRVFCFRHCPLPRPPPRSVVPLPAPSFCKLGHLGDDPLNTRCRVISHLPTMVRMPRSGMKVLAVSCGVHHTAFVTDRGELYTFGSNDKGQLGVGKDWGASAKGAGAAVVSMKVRQKSANITASAAAAASVTAMSGGATRIHRFKSSRGGVGGGGGKGVQTGGGAEEWGTISPWDDDEGGQRPKRTPKAATSHSHNTASFTAFPASPSPTKRSPSRSPTKRSPSRSPVRSPVRIKDHSITPTRPDSARSARSARSTRSEDHDDDAVKKSGRAGALRRQRELRERQQQQLEQHQRRINDAKAAALRPSSRTSARTKLRQQRGKNGGTASDTMNATEEAPGMGGASPAVSWRRGGVQGARSTLNVVGEDGSETNASESEAAAAAHFSPHETMMPQRVYLHDVGENEGQEPVSASSTAQRVGKWLKNRRNGGGGGGKGRGNNATSSASPTLAPTFCTSVVCGEDYTLAVFGGKTAYVWGDGRGGKLGILELSGKSCWTPQRLILPVHAPTAATLRQVVSTGLNHRPGGDDDRGRKGGGRAWTDADRVRAAKRRQRRVRRRQRRWTGSDDEDESTISSSSSEDDAVGGSVAVESAVQLKSPTVGSNGDRGDGDKDEGGGRRERKQGLFVSTAHTQQEAPVGIAGADPSDVTTVAAGDHHSMAIDGCGRLWAWGHGDGGRLGLGTEDSWMVPALVKSFGLHQTCQSVALGTAHSIVLCEGEVYTWGQGDMGQLGHGDRKNLTLPQRVPLLSGKGVCVVQAGGWHSESLR